MKIIIVSACLTIALVLGVTENVRANADHSATGQKQGPPSARLELKVSNTYDHRVGKVVQLFSEVANIYEEPSDKSKQLGTISIGTPVKVLARMSASSNKNGFEDAWLKIESNQNGKLLSGYIWGGELALAAYPLNEENKLLFGILGMKDPIDPEAYEKLAESRLVNSGKILSRAAFRPLDMVLQRNHYSYEVEAKKVDNKGFSNSVEIVALKFSYEACDYPNGDILFTWNGKQLSTGPEVTVTNGPDYMISTSYAYTLPSDQGGIQNCITVKYTETLQSEDDESSNTLTNRQKKIIPKETFKYYLWNGEKLTKAEKCKKD